MTDMASSYADLAKVCQYALEFGLIDFQAVRRWGDLLILSSQEPPLWALDLADCHPENVHERLWRVPGTPDNWENTLHGLVSMHWRAESITMAVARNVGWNIYLNNDQNHWGVLLDHYLEMHEEGHVSLRELEDDVNKVLAEFVQFEPLVPEWMLAKIPE